jgi:hypothetical protein
MSNDFDPAKYTVSPEQIREQAASVPRRIRKRREQFVSVPWSWVERLAGAPGQTYRVALCVLHLHWKGHGKPFKLPNGMLRIDGVSPRSKWRALDDLERRGLIAVERRRKRSPIVRVL